MGREQFNLIMRTEWFIPATNPLGLEGCAGDIFVGYR